jgi:WD40 repeat protein
MLEFNGNSSIQPFNPELRVKLNVTNGPVFSLDWSPDGRMLASSGYGQIRLWDAAIQKETAALQGHTHFIWGLAWSPDGSCLASASQDGSVKLWNSATWQNIANFDTGGWSFCVSWSPDGKRLAVGTGLFPDPSRPETFSGKSQIWNAETHQMVGECRVSSLIISTAWSPDGRTLAIGQWNGQITLWDGEAGTALKALVATSERSDVNGLAWSADGLRLAAAQQDGKLRIWHPETGAILRTRAGHTGWLRGVAWSPDGRLLASAGEDGEIRVWRMSDGQVEGSCLTPAALPVWSLKWSPDGHWLAAGNLSLSYEVA